MSIIKLLRETRYQLLYEGAQVVLYEPMDRMANVPFVTLILNKHEIGGGALGPPDHIPGQLTMKIFEGIETISARSVKKAHRKKKVQKVKAVPRRKKSVSKGSVRNTKPRR